jgi:putative hemolysin
MEVLQEELIHKDELIESTSFNKIKSKLLVQALMRVLKLDRVNGVYKESSAHKGVEFIDHILAQLQITYEIPEDDLNNIPKNTPFIVVSNHPYGGIDGLILLSIILKQRPDFKIMVNYLLDQIPQLKEHTVAVDPFESRAVNTMNIMGIKKCLKLLSNDVPIGIFPAGEVSAFHLNRLKVSDKMWHPVVGKMIMKSGVKVLPVYFSGHNSIMFNMLGLINPNLRTARLPSELFNKHEKIKVRIGKPVSASAIHEFEDHDQMLRFLRAKTYSLGSSLDVREHFLLRPRRRTKEPKAIIGQTEQALLLEDIERIQRNDTLLFSHQQYKVFVAGATEIPNILREISRLREITFREAGEGTNHSCDTDEFDLHYKHLFVWDDAEKKIVGAYRIGEGYKLFKRFKKKGFYLNELFKFSKDFNTYFRSSLEMGRSFIVKEYQRKPYSLMLLWKGVNEFIKRSNNRYKYLIGPVSISNNFSKLSKDILVDYIYKNHFDKDLAEHVRPRKQYKYQHRGEGKELKDAAAMKDMKFLDQVISDIEPDHAKIPVLLKKYLMRNAKIIAFNVDPDFNNSLDGLLVMKLDEVPTETFDLVS